MNRKVSIDQFFEEPLNHCESKGHMVLEFGIGAEVFELVRDVKREGRPTGIRWDTDFSAYAFKGIPLRLNRAIGGKEIAVRFV